MDISQNKRETIESIKKRSYNLKNLYLDPNNYRFVDNSNYMKVTDTELIDDVIQRRTRNFIEGNKRENIKDLIASFKSNGFLDVDVIQVQDLGNNNYLVIEGNRRVATLKCLYEDYEKGLDLGSLNPEVFKKIPFEIHEKESKEKHLIIMGLKHISGNKKWSAINQAQLIYDFLKPYWKTDEYSQEETKLCESLGITKVKLRVSQRAYNLILAYKKSDYGDQFESDMYYTFAEITKKPSIKEWLDWDDSQYKAMNYNNLQRLFSWLSKEEKHDDSYEGDNEEEPRPPIITKYREINDLAIFIDNENALNEMEKHESISRGLLASGAIEKQHYDKALMSAVDGLEKLKNYKDMVSVEDLDVLKKNYEELISKKTLLEMTIGNHSVCFEHDNHITHFSSLSINKYKVFNDFKIDKLNKINIFAGFNNSGKTSLLEAVYYLSKQNDIVAFLEVIKLKNKLKSLNPVWLNEVFGSSEIINIEGVFNNIQTSIIFNKFEAKNIDKKDDYIASYSLEAVVNDRKLDNIIHTFEYEPIKRKNEKVEHLCNSIFKSPYFYNLNEIVETYNKTTQYKTKEGKTAINLVIDFVRRIDDSINDIRLNYIDDIERFIVDSNRFSDKNLEITNYGEGLQRIFELALSFAYSRNGIVCIDEFETAIHTSLLIEFTKFIQELAEEFNVQVFLTSHSKESIDAFVNNGYRNDEISAYHLTNNDNVIEKKYISGERLQYLVKNISLDIRGNND